MSTPNPLVPQGSLQQSASRKRTRLLVFGVIGVHVVALGGLLFQGCGGPTDTGAGTPVATDTTIPPAAPAIDAGLVATNPLALPGGAGIGAGMPAIPANTNPIPGAGFGPQPGGAYGGAAAIPGVGGTAPMPATPGGPSPFPATPETATPPPASEGGEHKVVPKDTLAVIAKKHGVTLKALEAANPGVDSRRLKIGQIVKIPAGGKPAGASPVPGTSAAAPSAESGTYKVKKGDTLTGIAKKNGTTAKELKRVNNLKTDQIKVDQVLKVPAKAAATPPAPEPAPEPAPAPAPPVPAYTPLPPPAQPVGGSVPGRP